MILKSFKYTLTAALLLAAVNLCGQNKSAGINLSLWNHLSTQTYNAQQKTYFNLGLQSQQNKLYGLGVNLLSSQTTQAVKGVQIAGLSTTTGGSFSGFQAAGLVSLTKVHANGVTWSGLINIVGESQRGWIASGAVNLIGIDSKGFTLAGIANLGGYNSQGLAIAGVINRFKEDVKGVSLAGLVAQSESLYGLSLAGLIQLSENSKGMSFAPMNITTNHFYGVQLGLINLSKRHQGLQIGLVNYYKEQMKGLQLGLVNINRNTKYDLLVYGGNQTKVNLAVRFRNQLFYNIVGVGSPYLKFKDKFSAALNYRTGIHFPLTKQLDLSTDLGFSHINTFANKDKAKGIPRRLYNLAYRLNAEYIPSSKWSLFLSGGYATTRWYSQSKTYKKGFLLEVGIAHRL